MKYINIKRFIDRVDETYPTHYPTDSKWGKYNSLIQTEFLNL